jgi:tetratricopeptide (TPR) repeat protein
MTFIFTFLALSIALWMLARPLIRKRWQQLQREAKEEAHRQLAERRDSISALHRKADSLKRQHRHQEAIAVLDQIENEFHHETDPHIRSILSRASKEWVLNRGLLHPDDGKLPPSLHFDRDYLPTISARREFTIKLLQKQRLSVANVPSLAEEEKTIKSYLCKVFSLEKLNLDKEALAVLNHVQIQVGFNLDPIVTAKKSDIEKKIKAKGQSPCVSYDKTNLNYIFEAKRAWADKAYRQALLLKVTDSNADLLLKSNDLDVSVEARIQGDLGYALFLLGRHEQASQAIWKCLQLGKKSQLEAQRAYTRQQRIEPEDSDYEAMLTGVRERISPRKESEKS